MRYTKLAGPVSYIVSYHIVVYLKKLIKLAERLYTVVRRMTCETYETLCHVTTRVHLDWYSQKPSYDNAC